MTLRTDQIEVAKLVKPGESILEIGCGDGALLSDLSTEKSITARGLEIDQEYVNACAAAGLFVIQGDAENDLANYPDKAFDAVVMVQTLQTVNRPDQILKEVIRIGKRVIISVPNFGHWRVRFDLMLRGRMPMTRSLDTPWYQTENIHFCTLKDFRDLIKDMGLKITGFRALSRKGKVISTNPDAGNWRAEQGIFVLDNSP